MSELDEVQLLRGYLGTLAASVDKTTLFRYCLPQQGLWRRWTCKLAAAARRGFDVGYAPRHDWPAGLKHGVAGAGNRTLLIWAPGKSVVHGSAHEVREVCAAIADQLERMPGLVPVLVTDKADFAFYSRLGWLVEFLPALSADVAAYRDDKLRYLAWRYQGAVIVPAAAAFASPDDWRRIVGA